MDSDDVSHLHDVLGGAGFTLAARIDSPAQNGFIYCTDMDLFLDSFDAGEVVSAAVEPCVDVSIIFDPDWRLESIMVDDRNLGDFFLGEEQRHVLESFASIRGGSLEEAAIFLANFLERLQRRGAG